MASEMLWIEHTGNIYRGFFHDYPLKAWNSATQEWSNINGPARGPDWGNAITEAEAREYMKP